MHSSCFILQSWNVAVLPSPQDLTPCHSTFSANSFPVRYRKRVSANVCASHQTSHVIDAHNPIKRGQRQGKSITQIEYSSSLPRKLCGQGRQKRACVLVAASDNSRVNSELAQQGEDRSLPVQIKEQNGLPGATQDGLFASSQSSGTDMIKLFNDAQQNMLFLNRQRLMAVEELQKAEREQEFLEARVAQLEAEMQAVLSEKDVIEQRLKSTEATLEVLKNKGDSSTAGVFPAKEAGGRPDPPAIWSSLLLRIDSMLLSRVIDGSQAQGLRELVWAREHKAAEIYMEFQEAGDKDLAGQLLGLLDGNKRRGLHVVHLCTELAPVAQAGSLASWITGLCRALRKKGHLVEVILPRYAFLDASHIDDFRETSSAFRSYFGGEWHQNKIWTGTVYGLPVTFIDPLHPAGFFARDTCYGYEDDFERFTYFSRAALDWIHQLGKRPDVIHLHNWHTSAAAPLFWDHFCEQGLQDTRVFLTCHNFKYQSTAEPEKLALCGLDPGQLFRPDRLQDNQDPSKVNLLKGGIVYSNKVTTVSLTYAADVKKFQTGESHGLDATIKTHENKIVGLPSGVDDSEWDPSRDRFLPVPFSAEHMAGKAVARMELRQRLGLPAVDSVTGYERPLVGCIVPLVAETELALIGAATDCSLECGAQFVVVGASKAPRIQAQLEELQRERMDENAEVVVRLDPAMIHLLIAAADILVCLDTRDPLAQYPLIARRYGTIPVARQLAGGNDSLVDVDAPTKGATEGTAFTFPSSSAQNMTEALQRAIQRIGGDPEQWAAYCARAMRADSSWDAQSSDAYIEAYWSIRRC